MNESDCELIEESGNVFRDFGDPHADLKKAKTIVAARIIAVLDERGLTVRKAEDMTGFAAADFSRIRNASLGRFTLDRLMKILAALDGPILVTFRVEPRWTGTTPSRCPAEGSGTRQINSVDMPVVSQFEFSRYFS